MPRKKGRTRTDDITESVFDMTGFYSIYHNLEHIHAFKIRVYYLNHYR